MTRTEERQLNELVADLAAALDVKLSASQVMRASLSLLHRREPEILAAARELAIPRRPSNGDPLAMAQFEDALADILLRGLQRGQ